MQLKDSLTQLADKVDASYPNNTELTLDEEGKPHLKRLRAESLPEGLEEFKERVRARMPERHLLDVLKNAHYWVNYTRHFTPPSGSDPKMSDTILRHLFTVFGYGCNLGAAQTARHTGESITQRILQRINAQHVTTEKCLVVSTNHSESPVETTKKATSCSRRCHQRVYPL